MQRRDWRAILQGRKGKAEAAGKPPPPAPLVPRCRWCKRKLTPVTTYIGIAPEYQTTSIEATARLIEGGQIVSYDRGYYPGQSIHAPTMERPVVGVRVWDGKAYKGQPRRLPIFCTAGCAIEFALDAHQHGHRRK